MASPQRKAPFRASKRFFAIQSLTSQTIDIMLYIRYKLDTKPMLECCWGAPMSRWARLRAGETLFRERAGEIVAAVVRQAEAGGRPALRLPPPGAPSRRAPPAGAGATSAPRAQAHPSRARVIALSDAKTRRRAGGALPQCNGRDGE